MDFGGICTAISIFIPAALGPVVYSVCNRNEYQKQKKDVSGE
jgi:hypothetical protein